MEEVTTKKTKKRKKLPKDVLNIIRTTMRNNIELTHIADNKANVLLSLNALMLTFLVPFIIPYMDIVKQYRLGIPLTILVVTCFITIYIAALVLKPGKFYQNQKEIEQGKLASPFYFGNFYKMSKEKYVAYVDNAISENEVVKNHLTEDLHALGARLGRKMELIRIAFNIFLIGLFTSISIALVLFTFIN